MKQMNNEECTSDRCDKAWDFYENVYSGNDFFSKFKISWENAKKKRYVVLQDPKTKTEYKLSGDLIFNYSTTGCIRYNKLEKFASESKRELLKEFPNNCGKENIALLLSTGNMQSAKQGIGYDRGDTFLWALDQYYSGSSEIIMNHATYQNVKMLRDFLDIIKAYSGFEGRKVVYYYAEQFYNIENNEEGNILIDNLIQCGSRAIDNVEVADNHIELVSQFWRMRRTKVGI